MRSRDRASIQVQAPPPPPSTRTDPGTSPRHPGGPASLENPALSKADQEGLARETWPASTARRRASSPARRSTIDRAAAKPIVSGQDRRERRRDAEPIAIDEREKDPRQPEDENQACEAEANRRPTHRHESDHENGERNRRSGVDPTSRRRPRQSVASQKIADRGREALPRRAQHDRTGSRTSRAAPAAVTPTMTTLPRSASGSRSPRRTCAALMRLKLPAGP